MRHRVRLLGSAAWGPLPLRIAVGAVFLWAGLGKWFAHDPLPESARPVLVEMNVATRASGTPAVPRQPEGDAIERPAAPAAGSEGVGIDEQQAEDEGAGGVTVKTAGGSKAGSEAPPVAEPMFEARRVWCAAYGIHVAANPRMPENQTAQPRAIWPGFLGTPSVAKAQAIALMVVEALGGALILVGLLTRVSGLALAGAMLGAMWLDQLGPAFQAGKTVLGFIPERPIWDTGAWRTLFWQACLLAMSVGLVLLGAGRLSMDEWISGARRDHDHDEL